MEAGALRASDSAWGAVRRDCLPIVTHVGHKSAIDGCARRKPYFPAGSLDFLPFMRAPNYGSVTAFAAIASAG
jgi:hypothetical protein